MSVFLLANHHCPSLPPPPKGTVQNKGNSTTVKDFASGLLNDIESFYGTG